MDFVEEISYPLTTLVSLLGTMAPLLIYFFVGELVGENPEVGDDYFTFATIGLVVATILQAALSGFGGSLQKAQNRGTFETLLVEPVPWLFLPFAMNLWRVVDGVFGGLLVFLFGWLLGAQYIPAGIPQFLVLLVLGILASMAVGIVSASLLVLAKKSQPILWAYGFAASLLSGALFSVEQLPPFLQSLALVIPHTYVINSARALLMEDPGTFSIPFDTAVLALTIFNVVVFSLGLWLFARSLQYARKMGILAGY
jgi:ABC-2 type transport system permease protein